MSRPTKQSPERGSARTRLLEAARDIVRTKGFAATTVDDLCRAADVTKGAFFHHFASKDALGVAAADIPASPSRGKETFFDGKVFDPENPQAYLKSLSIKRVEV